MLKGKNTVKLGAVLAILVVIFLVVKFTGNSDRSESFRDELVNLEVEKVTKVELLSPADTTILEQKDGSWVVDDEKPADSDLVKSMLKNLNTIEPSRLASRSEEKWQDFQVDDSGLRVKAYENGNQVLDIILGRFNVEGQRSYYSYVRLAEESDTYVAQNFMKMSVSVGSEAYRIDDIVKINKDSLKSISFDYPEESFELTKGSEYWVVDGEPVDSAAVAKYISGLRRVTSRKFSEEPTGSQTGTVTYQLANGGSHKVTRYEPYNLTSSFNKVESWQDSTVVNKLFKDKSYFLTGENL